MSQENDSDIGILTHYGEDFTNFLVEQDADEVVEHFGIKGMKWGRRSAESKARIAREPDPDVSVTRATGKHITTKGGEGLGAHDDAIDARIVKQKIAKSGLNSVSNRELQSYVNRLNLEQQYARLSPNEKHKGEQAAQTVLKKSGKVAENVVSQIASELLKSAIKDKIDTVKKASK